MSVAKGTLFRFVEWMAPRLRFPHLFVLTAILFLLDLLIPDLVPFADEILLGLATLLLGSWKKRKQTEGHGRGKAKQSGSER
ncbi:MAG: DUF6116 family protein [Candidatus Methylomirabilia bacterium]